MKIALYGAGGGGVGFEKCFRYSSDEVVVFFDRDMSKIGKAVNKIPVDDINQHANYNFDSVIISSQPNYEEDIYKKIISSGIDAHKIVPGSILRNGHNSYFNLPKNINEIRACVSGLSYHRDSILQEYCCIPTYNYSRSSQDIFYDYMIARLIVSNTQKGNIKFWFIGLCGYSLEYDLSRSVNWKRCFYYKDKFGTHNLLESYKDYYLNKYDYKSTLKKFSKQSVNNISDMFYVKEKKAIEVCSEGQIVRQVKKDFSKNYPETVRENTIILKKYVSLVRSHGAIPIIFIPPVHPVYKKLSENNITQNLLNQVKMLTQENCAYFINGYELDGYSNFNGGAHLNIQDGILFTKHINSFIKSL